MTLDLIKSGISQGHEYLCTFTDLWTGEKLGTARDRVLISDVVPHGNIAVRIKCIRQIYNDEDTVEEFYIHETAYVEKEAPIENLFLSSL